MIARQRRSVLAGGVDAGGAIVLGAVAAAVVVVVAGIGDVGEAIHQRAQSVDEKVVRTRGMACCVAHKERERDVLPLMMTTMDTRYLAANCRVNQRRRTPS